METLLQSSVGEIVACNIVHGIREQLIEGHFARSVLDWVGRLATHLGSSRSEDLVDAIAVVRDGDYPAGLGSRATAPDFRAHWDPVPSLPQPDFELSCVMAASALRELIDPADMERLRASGLLFPTQANSRITAEAIRDWRERPARERHVRFNPSASLGRGAVVWFTRRDSLLQAQRQDDRDSGQRARDALGLVHYPAGIVLGALHIPARALQTLSFSRPNFLDAANHTRFKTWPDGMTTRLNRTWGYAADLAKVASGVPNVDGCVERVTTTIPGASLAPLGTFEVELLGAVEDSADNCVEAHRTFAKRLRGQLTADKLAYTLQEQLGLAEGTA